MIGSSSGSSSGGNGGSPEKEHNTTSTSSIHPMSPSSGMIDSNGSLPPQRMKVILEQAHGKLGTLLLLLCFLLHGCFWICSLYRHVKSYIIYMNFLLSWYILFCFFYIFWSWTLFWSRWTHYTTGTLKNEGAVWIQHSEKCFDICRQLATRIAHKLGPPPGNAPTLGGGHSSHNADHGIHEEEEGDGTLINDSVVATGLGPPPPTTQTKNHESFSSTTMSTTPATTTMTATTTTAAAAAASTTSIADAPIGTVHEEVARSKEYLRRIIKTPKPPLSTKLLSR